MTNKIEKRREYRIVFECKQVNKWAEKEGMTAGLKFMVESFHLMMMAMEKFNGKYKSRKITIERVE